MAKKKEEKAKKDKAKKKAKKKEKKGKKGQAKKKAKKKQKLFPANVNFKGNPAHSAGLPFFLGKLSREYFFVLAIAPGRNYKTWLSSDLK